MKDIQIQLTVKRQKTEILIWIVCFIIAFGLNVYSIISFGTQWKELYTQLLWVFSLSVLFYGILLFFRLIYAGVRALFRKSNTPSRKR